jgi:hypothetical protein
MVEWAYFSCELDEKNKQIIAQKILTVSIGCGKVIAIETMAYLLTQLHVK